MRRLPLRLGWRFGFQFRPAGFLRVLEREDRCLGNKATVAMFIEVYLNLGSAYPFANPPTQGRNRNPNFASSCSELVINLALESQLAVCEDMPAFDDAGDSAYAILLSRPEFELGDFLFHADRQMPEFFAQCQARNSFLGEPIWSRTSILANKTCRFVAMRP